MQYTTCFGPKVKDRDRRDAFPIQADYSRAMFVFNLCIINILELYVDADWREETAENPVFDMQYYAAPGFVAVRGITVQDSGNL